MSALTAEQQRKVNQIKAALEQSDRAVHDHFASLDRFERSAMKVASGRVSGPWLDTLDKLRTELLAARDRLDQIHTGLSAQRFLRASLIQMASGVAAWRHALGSNDTKQIDAAITSMNRHFAAAEANGVRGALYLKRGR